MEFAEQLRLGLEEQFPEVDGLEAVEAGVTLLLVLMVLLVLLSLLNLLVSSLLIHGASVGRPSLLTPWLLLASLSILPTAAAAHCVLVHWHAEALLLTTHLVITSYCLLCGYALRKEQIKGRGQAIKL